MRHLYFEHDISINLHLLTHLEEDISRFGPLFTHTMFPYEHMNGVFTRNLFAKGKVPLYQTNLIASRSTFAHENSWMFDFERTKSQWKKITSRDPPNQEKLYFVMI
jgi:hypothetical protein